MKLRLYLPGFAALLTVIIFTGCQQNREDTLRVSIAGKPFHLELAMDPQARFEGLSDREAIADDGGMLFVFPDARVRYFVMRRCFVPIDIIFIGEGGHVVATHAMQVEPIDWDNESWDERDLTRYASHWPAQFAIELQGGMVKKLGVKEGDRIELPRNELLKRVK